MSLSSHGSSPCWALDRAGRRALLGSMAALPEEAGGGCRGAAAGWGGASEGWAALLGTRIGGSKRSGSWREKEPRLVTTPPDPEKELFRRCRASSEDGRGRVKGEQGAAFSRVAAAGGSGALSPAGQECSRGGSSRRPAKALNLRSRRPRCCARRGHSRGRRPPPRLDAGCARPPPPPRVSERSGCCGAGDGCCAGLRGRPGSNSWALITRAPSLRESINHPRASQRRCRKKHPFGFFAGKQCQCSARKARGDSQR